MSTVDARSYYNLWNFTRPITSKSTHLFCVDGFQRQGNNSLRKLFLESFPTISINRALTHEISDIERNLSKGMPCVVSLRRSLGTASSLVSYQNKKNNIEHIYKDEKTLNTYMRSAVFKNTIDYILGTHLEYFQYIFNAKNDYKNNFFIATFDNLVYNSYDLIEDVRKKFNIENVSNYKFENKLTNISGHNSTANDAIERYILDNFILELNKLDKLYDMILGII
jgi:hypothetical protein